MSAAAARLAAPALQWSDFHLVMTIAAAGSVARSLDALGMTHATALRKLAHVERRLGARVFDRSRSGYVPTPAGEKLLEAASAMDTLATAAQLGVLGQDLRPSGLVRVTLASIVMEHLLPPVLAQFAAAFPAITLELVGSRDHASLASREADVALRISDQVPPWLVGRQLGHVDFRVYGLRRQARPPALRPVEALLGERGWIGFERDVRDLKFDRWLAATVPDAAVALRVESFSHALAMVRAGLGMALLPTFVQATCRDLQPLTPPLDELRTPLWLLTHQALRHTARIKVLTHAVGTALAQRLQALDDGAPAAGD